jgi:hypothetical protein
MKAVLWLGALIVASMGGSAWAGQPPAGAKAPDPWPDAAALAARRETAERRPLFASHEPLSFTLAADFKAVQRDRKPESTQTFPATLSVAGPDESQKDIPLRIRTRGHSRRLPSTCTFAPLRLEFESSPIGTVFEGPRALKLGTHCRDVNDYEQYVYREYLVYRMFSLLTPRSFRARLAKATYIDAASKKTVAVRAALLLEDDDDVARRHEGRIDDAQQITFRSVDADTITLLTVFAYMIGNTDMSMYRQHNIRLVRVPSGALYPVPYDFDYSGLVHARYAIPDKQFGLATVRDRLYRGPCRTNADFERVFAKMREVKADVMALYDSVPEIQEKYRRDARQYLEQFYRTIDRPKDVKRAFLDDCGNRAGM